MGPGEDSHRAPSSFLSVSIGVLFLYLTSRLEASLREEATATGAASGQHSSQTQGLFKALGGPPALRLSFLLLASHSPYPATLSQPTKFQHLLLKLRPQALNPPPTLAYQHQPCPEALLLEIQASVALSPVSEGPWIQFLVLCPTTAYRPLGLTPAGGSHIATLKTLLLPSSLPASLACGTLPLSPRQPAAQLPQA